MQSPRARWWPRAPTRCRGGPRGRRARLSRQAELSEGVWSGRREAGHLPFWTGVAPRGPGISLVQDHGLLGGGLLCAGLICEGLSTRGLLAGFTRKGQLLGMWVFPVQVLRVSRHHLTDRTHWTPILSDPCNSIPFHFKGLRTCRWSRTRGPKTFRVLAPSSLPCCAPARRRLLISPGRPSLAPALGWHHLSPGTETSGLQLRGSSLWGSCPAACAACDGPVRAGLSL